MERIKYLIIPAGGSGTRMGGPLPKQFMEIGGKPVLRITIERFLEAYPDINIICALPQDSIAYWKGCCVRGDFNCRQRIVEGGFTRFHSVKNALSHVPDGALVAVHDAVRPLVSQALIKAAFEAAEKEGAVIPTLPSSDTLREVVPMGAGVLPKAAGTLDRESIHLVQTPQVFHSELLRAAYSSQGYSTSFTDDASVVIAAGGIVKCIPGEKLNFKLTVPQDFTLASLFLTE